MRANLKPLFASPPPSSIAKGCPFSTTIKVIDESPVQEGRKRRSLREAVQVNVKLEQGNVDCSRLLKSKGYLYLLLNLKNGMNQLFEDLSISEPGDYQLLFEIAVLGWYLEDTQAIPTLTSDIRVTEDEDEQATGDEDTCACACDGEGL